MSCRLSSASAWSAPAPTGQALFLDNAGIEVREDTAPDKPVRRKKGKDDTLDAENAAHAAHAGIRTLTPRSAMTWSNPSAV